MAIPSVHLSTTPTRWKVLEELRQLLGNLDEQVAAQWQTHTLLQRRDAELDCRAQTESEEKKQSEQSLANDRAKAGQRMGDEETDTAVRQHRGKVSRQEVVETDGQNGSDEQQLKTDRKEKRRKKAERDEQSTSKQQQPTAARPQPVATEPMLEQQAQKKRKRAEDEESTQPSQQQQQRQQHSKSEAPFAIVRPLEEITIDDSPAPSPHAQPLLPAHGMQEIDISIDSDDNTSPPPPPQVAPPQTVPSLPLPPPPPPPLPSRVALLSVLTFLMPSRDPAAYAAWSAETLVQRIQAEYASQLSDLSLPTELSTELLFAFAHLLSPVILPTGSVRPVFVDSEVCRLIREVAAHVMAAIHAAAEAAVSADGEEEDEEEDDEDEEDEERESNVVPVDEARLALNEVLRVSGMIGMEVAEVAAIQQWLESVAPAFKPSVTASSHSTTTNGTHRLSASTPSSSPSRASTSSSTFSSASASSTTTSAVSPSSSACAVSLTAAVAAAKPRYIVLDGANIGRWSGSGDPSADVTVTTTTSRPSHLQHLPSTDSRTMSRLASWQLVAAVHAVEQQLGVPALICLPEQFIRRPERFAVQDSELLLLLQKQGKLHRLPTGADDDSALLQMAESANTWIVSNDNFRDHVYSGRVTRQWADERLIKFYTIEFPRVGSGGVGGVGDGGVATEEGVRERGQVCLVEPSALRRNMHAKEDMEREKEREDAETAAAAQTAQHVGPPAAGNGAWYDGQHHISKTGYPSILSFPLHPPPQTRPHQPHYPPPHPPSASFGYPPHPHSYPPPAELYMHYPPPAPPLGHHSAYPPVGPYWPSAAPPAGSHPLPPYGAPPSYAPPSAGSAAASHRTPSQAPPQTLVYPPGALRPEHFHRSRRS